MVNFAHGGTTAAPLAASIVIDLASGLGSPAASRGCRLLLLPKDGRARLVGLPIEEIIVAGPSVDLDPANLAVEAAGMLVRMLLLGHGVGHPAIGAVEMFGRPNATGHPGNMPRESSIFQPVQFP